MAMKVCHQGEDLFLQAIFGKTAAATSWRLRLFSNNHVPAVTDTEANYTEVAGGGYAAIVLVAASWTIVQGTPTVGTQPVQTFTFTGPTNAPGTIYGYYVTDVNGKLLFAEQLPAPPFSPSVNGDSIAITPTFSDQST